MRLIALSTVAAALLASEAVAQQNAAVQLPTFSFFSTNTTVSVPDRGSALLGGIGRSSEGRNEFGVPGLGQLGRPFKNSAIGSQKGAMSTRVTVQIHDFEEMDEAILGQPASAFAVAARQAREAGAVASLPPRPAGAGSSWAVSKPAGGTAALSVAEVKAQRAAEQASKLSEANDYFQRGQKAEAEGKKGVAKIYYQMAARRATGQLKDQVLVRLDAVSVPRASAQLAQGGR